MKPGVLVPVNGFSLLKFEAIIFDLDSTLTDTNAYPIRASEWLLSQCAPNPSELLPEYILELVRNYRAELKQIVRGAPYKTPYDVVKDATRTTAEVLELPISDDLLERGTQYFRQLHIEMSDLMPGAKPLLSSLKANGTRMGVVTNSFEGHVDIILEDLGVAQYFTVTVDGSDVEAYKPMRQPFEYSLQKLGASADVSLMVGDEFYADIVGASSAGIMTVWVNWRERNLDELMAKYEGVSPDIVVDSLEELVNFL
ncbi:MAG: HAD family hydrolase [Candidatus Thorarchaeota archaeon]